MYLTLMTPILLLFCVCVCINSNNLPSFRDNGPSSMDYTAGRKDWVSIMAAREKSHKHTDVTHSAC